MAWRRIGAKPLSEAMLTQFTDAYMRHNAEISKQFDQAYIEETSALLAFCAENPSVSSDFVAKYLW